MDRLVILAAALMTALSDAPADCGHGVRAAGRCVCEPAFRPDAAGLCTLPRPPLACGHGVAVKGRCVCEPGSVRNPAGVCVGRQLRTPPPNI